MIGHIFRLFSTLSNGNFSHSYETRSEVVRVYGKTVNGFTANLLPETDQKGGGKALKEKDGNIQLFRELVLGESFFEIPQNDLHQVIQILSGAEALLESEQFAGS